MLFFLVGWLYVLLAPYTKVEESFNLHATHDLIYHGLLPRSLPNYDHFVFPGVVPRSFIGSLVLSGIVVPIKFAAQAMGILISKRDVQVLVRLCLATLNALGFFHLRRAVRRRFGVATSTLFIVLTCTQFHIPFWMGRTLPNMFALFPVTLACARLVEPTKQNCRAAIALLTFAAVTLRMELVLFLGPLTLQALYLRRMNFEVVIKTGLMTGVLSLALTLGVDSYFWNQWPLWPELAGLYFNVYEGKSAEWGTSPSYTYFLSHLPRLLLSSLPLSLLGALTDSRARSLLLPCVAFVMLLSCLGHKEWRFVVYVVPIWNVAGARGANWLLSARGRGVMGRVVRIVCLGLLIANVGATVLLTIASMANYPGGEALSRLNHILARQADGMVAVHIDNYAAQTGASLFLHEHVSRVVYNKTEHLVAPRDFDEFDWVITEHPKTLGKGWQVEESVEGLQSVELRKEGLLVVPWVVREPKLWLLQRSRG